MYQSEVPRRPHLCDVRGVERHESNYRKTAGTADDARSRLPEDFAGAIDRIETDPDHDIVNSLVDGGRAGPASARANVHRHVGLVAKNQMLPARPRVLERRLLCYGHGCQ